MGTNLALCQGRGGRTACTLSRKQHPGDTSTAKAGRYKEALDALRASIKGGLPAKVDELRAHKYAAFAYCLTQRTKECRAEFKQIFVKEPSFGLLPSEAGHPSWVSIYRSEKATAAKKMAADKKAEEAKKTAEAKKAGAAKTELKK